MKFVFLQGIYCCNYVEKKFVVRFGYVLLSLFGSPRKRLPDHVF